MRFNSVKLNLRTLLIAGVSLTTIMPLPGNLTLAAQSTLPAQPSVVAPPIKFDVVTIRENKSETEKPGVISPHNGDSITYRNYPLASIVMFVYEFHRFDLGMGFPEWAKAERYDITAKVAPENVDEYHKLNRAQRELMFEQVFADRLQLRVHREFRELPVYDLVIAKGGPKLKEAAADETYPDGLKAKYGQSILFTRADELEAQGSPISDLALMLSDHNIGRQVIDKTGLTGKYDFTLKWADQDENYDAEQAPSSPANLSGPSLFTAIQEQLGLKLQPSTGPVECFIVDHIERPSEN